MTEPTTTNETGAVAEDQTEVRQGESTSVREKDIREYVDRLLSGGATVSEIAVECGKHESTVESWYNTRQPMTKAYIEELKARNANLEAELLEALRTAFSLQRR